MADQPQGHTVHALPILIRRASFVVIALLACGFAVFTFAGPQGWPALRQKRESVERLRQDNEALRQRVVQRRERIKRLKDSRTEQELEIRRQLKYLKPGESYFVLPPGKPAN